MLRLYDTASEQLQPLVGRDPGAISMYVCGPTVYAPPHVGHGRFMLVYDVLRRYLEFTGTTVVHVSNVTDIDDKIINRANEESRPWQEIAAEAEQEWWSAMDALGVLRPTAIPHATEYIAEMTELIVDLVARGAAYAADDGIYLEVSKVPEYGLLSHQSVEERRAGVRVEIDEAKRAPEDFVLWKAVKSGEPSWSAPFGPGRPGWHTECVAMALRILGDGFDIHGGGLDLVFPHHENERAQAVQLGRRFACLWVHNGFVTLGGDKMSKSVGNVSDLSSLIARSDPRAYRLLVLRAQYRSPLEVNEDLLDDASTALGRIDALARRVNDAPSAPPEGSAEELATQFAGAMDDDLDTPGAVAFLFDALRRANTAFDGGDFRDGAALGSKVIELFGVLGVVGIGVRNDASSDVWASERARQRDAARAAKDFAASDAIRSELEAAGWSVEDTPNGTRVQR